MEDCNELVLEFVSRPENVAVARVTVAALAAQLDPSLPELDDVRLAVSEAVTNATIHAYPGTTGRVVVRARLCQRRLTVEIIDYGQGIADIEQARQPSFSTDPNPERMGLGFAFMESCMDQVEVESAPGRGTTIRLIKEFPEVPAEDS
ncbi:MAG: anti-sigma F factor [Bacillota bacterium]